MNELIWLESNCTSVVVCKLMKTNGLSHSDREREREREIYTWKEPWKGDNSKYTDNRTENALKMLGVCSAWKWNRKGKRLKRFSQCAISKQKLLEGKIRTAHKASSSSSSSCESTGWKKRFFWRKLRGTSTRCCPQMTESNRLRTSKKSIQLKGKWKM